MENNTEKHTPFEHLVYREFIKYGDVYPINTENETTIAFSTKDNALIIIEQLNSHTRLLQENGELKEQLQKAEQDKKYMGEMLVLIRDCYKSDAKVELDRGKAAASLYYSAQSKNIENLLNQCGIAA